MSDLRKKPCCVCRQWFRPNPRVGARCSGCAAKRSAECCTGKKPKPSGGAGTRVTPSPTGSISGRHKTSRLKCCEYPLRWTNYRGNSRKTSSGLNTQISWGCPTGISKTGLASGLLLKALQNGYRGQFIGAQNLVDEMYASLADRSTRQLLNRLARLDILLIDEFGYLNLKPEQSNIFFKLMEERYHRHSTIITTNLVYDEWQNFLGNKSMVEAPLSRVRHYCHTVTINGPSLRDPQGELMEQRDYVRRLLDAYRTTPGTCGAVRRPDRLLAAQLHQRGVPLEAVENALTLAAARRLARHADAPPLAIIRSLAYFSPVIEEVLSLSVSPEYFRYLRQRIATFTSAQ
jgi:hypothetical protein